MKIDKSKFKKIVMCAITALGTVFVGLTLFAKAKRKTSVYENEKQEKNPMEGKRVVFVRNDDDNENKDGKVVGTVEKKVVSNHAICGAYVVKNAQMFRDMAEEYLKHCDYSEFFVSGIYNVMCKKGYEVKNYTVDFHVPFGTPIEYEKAQGSEYFDELL